MMFLEISLGIILVVLALIVVLQNKPLKAIILSGAFSASAAITYFFIGAPDVAMAEASIGAVFTTFVYIVALKHSGKLRVGYIDQAGLIKRGAHGYEGVEYELLKLFSEDRAMSLEMKKIDSFDSIEKLENFDIICGGMVESTFSGKLRDFMLIPYLETNIFKTKKGEKLDLVRIKNLVLSGQISPQDIDQNTKEFTKYVFLISKESEDVGKALTDFLQNLDKKIFNDIVRRNLG
ncbi:MAG TPA: DUF4040 domain-containing protein [Thermotogaceae bacterium]|nr:DUF4040 domain-containing protein [Thermotogota bacterium]HEW92873.1 DUF4040 domain-containing protein [Thermotogaceae bacterium]